MKKKYKVILEADVDIPLFIKTLNDIDIIENITNLELEELE